MWWTIFAESFPPEEVVLSLFTLEPRQECPWKDSIYPLRLPHAEAYDGMVVGWVGNATDAKRIEPLIIKMAHHIFPHHCVNCRQTGGEGISAGSQNASLYMCYGGRNTLLMRRVGENWASRGRLSDVLH